MAGKRRWLDMGLVDGIWTIQFLSWKYFYNYVTGEMLDYSHYVWRGDRCDNRPLLPSFDRECRRLKQETIEKRQKRHLDVFIQSSCGRRGNSPTKIEAENDWWALGQHYGLKTPLLDWTRSPFVALFFAFEKTGDKQNNNRAVYAINPRACSNKSVDIRKKYTGTDRPNIVEFFTPHQDENSRLLNQNGLFSRCTAGLALEAWVKEHWSGDNSNGILLKMLLPDENRTICLRTLNKMNINHLTLFPDLFGASNFANMFASITNY